MKATKTQIPWQGVKKDDWLARLSPWKIPWIVIEAKKRGR